ncbi:MAG: nuclease-related domain-containing protein [Acidimicrobiales bacterium]
MENSKLESAKQEWTRQRLERRLASDRRAGAWAESRAVGMRLDFIRRGWLLVALGPATACALAPSVLLIPRHARPYVLGGLVASGLWGAVYMVATMSGASSVSVGALSEQWTARELRRLRTRQWRLVNGVHYRSWDIDHVLLGPGGIVVVETKFSADGWERSRYTSRVTGDAIDRVRRNAIDVQLTLGKSALPDDLVHPVVVLWGRSDKREVSEKHGNVQVLSGHLLRGWLADLGDSGLDRATADRLYEKLVKQVTTRDQKDLDRAGLPARPISSSISLILLATALGLVSCVAELEAVHLAGWYWAVPIGLAFFALQLPLRRWRAARPWRVAWVAGSQIVTVAIALAYVGLLIARI